MIHSITFKNFFSFKEEGNLSLQVNENAPQTKKYFIDKSGERLSKILSVFGYNASGKTNALKPFSFLQWLITEAYTENPNKEMLVFPFKFTEEKNPTELSVKFSIDKSLYFYYIKLDSKKIINEKLQKKDFGKIKFSTLFERIWNNNKKYNYTWKDNFGLGSQFESRLRENASVLSTSIRDSHKESIEISNFWKNINTNLSPLGKIDDEGRNIFEAAKFFVNNPILKNKVDELLQKFDLGLNSISIKEVKEENSNNVSFNIRGVHYKKYELAFPFESSGTKKFFAILKNVLQALDNGGVAVIDEFDTDLHPMMSEALVEMFLSEQINLHNAQLIFSAHSPHLLNLFDKYQIVLAEKNKKGESEIWRLDEMKGVRLDDNYYVKYLSGAYGAIPDLNL